MSVVVTENSIASPAQGAPNRHATLPVYFTALALVFGTALVFVIAPFQAADEDGHFLRAYQVSDGALVPEWNDGRIGGTAPDSLLRTIGLFAGIARHPNVKASRAELKAAWDIPLTPDQCLFIHFNQAAYPPLAYLPQAAGIALGRLAGLPPLGLMWAGRLANLLVWTAIGAIALAATPICRRGFFVLLLMPMSLFQAASLSADALTNALAICFTSLVLRQAYRDRRGASDDDAFMGFAALLVLIMIATLVAATKAAYCPLALLLLLIPKERFGGAAPKRRAATATAVIIFLAMVACARNAHGLDGIVREDATNVSAPRQIEYLTSHPWAVFGIVNQTFWRDGWRIIRTFVGARLGWLDTPLPWEFDVIYLAALVAACRPMTREPKAAPSLTSTLILLSAALGSIFAVGLLNYLVWTQVGKHVIEVMQGRYFIPVAPAVLVLVWRVLSRFTPREARASDNRDGWTTLACAGSSAYVLFVVVGRYWGW